MDSPPGPYTVNPASWATKIRVKFLVTVTASA
jgi:hypothetical protein